LIIFSREICLFFIFFQNFELRQPKLDYIFLGLRLPQLGGKKGKNERLAAAAPRTKLKQNRLAAAATGKK